MCAVKIRGSGINNPGIVLGRENKGDEKEEEEDGGFHGFIVLNKRLIEI